MLLQSVLQTEGRVSFLLLLSAVPSAVEIFLRLAPCAPLYSCFQTSGNSPSCFENWVVMQYARVRLLVSAEHCFLATLAGQSYRATVQGVTSVNHVL